MIIKAIAVDDEPVALEIIRDHAKKVPFIDLKQIFVSPVAALSYLAEYQIDLVFLDIKMPDISGLKFANLIEKKTQVVFTTAYSEHALQGFELAVTDYLLKPICFERFLRSCQLVQSRFVEPLANKPANRELFVKSGFEWVRIDLDNLLYVQSQDNYVLLYEVNKRTLVRSTLNELMNKLPLNQFLRVDRSHIVSVSKIDKVERHQIVVAGTRILISNSYRGSVMAFFDR